MLSNFVGTFDWPATFVVVGVAASFAVAYAAWLARTPIKLQEMRMQNERDTTLAKYTADRDVQMAKVQQNLITSHRSTDE